MTKTVAIYRHQLGLPSESFIYTPLPYYQTFKPILVGTEFSGSLNAKQPYFVPPKFNKLDQVKHRLSLRNKQLKQWFSQQQPDLIHAHFAIDALYAAYFAKQINKPLLTTLHGFDVTRSNFELITSGNLSWLKYVLTKHKLWDYCSIFICVSDFIKNKALEAGFPEQKLMTHYIGIDTELFKAQPKKANSTFKILHVARLTEKKGTRYLLEAIAQLNDPNIQLTIAGDGPLKEAIAKQITDLNLAAQVTMLGFVSYSDIQQLMQRHDLLCVPSVTAADGDAEGLGMVFLEAAASGLPILATRHGGIIEAVKEGVTGFLVPERDSQALAIKLTELVKQPQLLQSITQKSHSWVRENFDIKSQTNALEQLYQKVLET